MRYLLVWFFYYLGELFLWLQCYGLYSKFVCVSSDLDLEDWVWKTVKNTDGQNDDT